MFNKDLTNQYVTKDASGVLDKDSVKKGQKSVYDLVAFEAVTGEALRKELGIEDLSSLPEGYVAGWASTKDLDHYMHVVQEGAFDESINEKGLSGPRGIKLLAGHRPDQPAGVIKVLETRNGRLWIQAELNLNISYVRDLYEAAKMNNGLSFSVGFFIRDYEFKTNDDDVEFLLIKRGELIEVSVVVFPGNDNAEMTFIKGISDQESFDSLAEFEKALVASGFAKSRNHAESLTLAVKRNVQLFAPKPTEPPRLELDPETLGEVNKSLDALRLMFSSKENDEA